jgi:hypothetical protein
LVGFTALERAGCRGFALRPAAAFFAAGPFFLVLAGGRGAVSAGVTSEEGIASFTIPLCFSRSFDFLATLVWMI